MIFYHIDHRGRLAPNLRIEPNTMRLVLESWPVDVILSVRETFPGGLSHFGTAALNPTAKPDIVRQHTFEFILEMVRLASFPMLPSRLTSFYGIRDWHTSLDTWTSRLEVDASKFRVFECASDRVYTVNAAWLDLSSLEDIVPTRAVLQELPDDKPVPAVSFPAALIHAARQYWLSCHLLEDRPPVRPASSDTAQAQCNPMPFLEELLAPGPVRVIRQIPLP